MITGVHHIAVISSTEKSVEFYNRLGFKEIFRKSREYDTIVILERYGMQLEVFIDPNHHPCAADSYVVYAQEPKCLEITDFFVYT